MTGNGKNNTVVAFGPVKDIDFCQEVSATRQGQITIYGELKKNTWRGRTTAQVLIKDYEIRDTTYEF